MDERVLGAIGIRQEATRIVADGNSIACALYSTSMREAKVIVRSEQPGQHPLAGVKHVRLRLRVTRREGRRELDLYIPATVMGLAPYNAAGISAMFAHRQTLV